MNTLPLLMRNLVLPISLFIIGPHLFAEEAINGAEVINNNCARCHNARPVQEFSLEEWSVIIPHMREKAHLSKQEADAVLAFYQLLLTGASRSNIDNTKAVSGNELMTRFGCRGCHVFQGSGGTIGPELDGIVSSRGRDFVSKKLTNPQFNNPASPMPKMPLSASEVNSLVEYLGQ